MVLLALAVSPAYAGCKDELIEAISTSVALLETKGAAALPELDRIRFCGGEGYVITADENLIALQTPVSKEFIGKDMSMMQDPNGKYFIVESKVLADRDGEGWVDYVWVNPRTKALAQKCSFIKAARMDGSKVYVMGGIYQEGGCN